MALFRSRLVCQRCNHHLPPAASHCPWCKTSISLPVIKSGIARFPTVRHFPFGPTEGGRQ